MIYISITYSSLAVKLALETGQIIIISLCGPQVKRAKDEKNRVWTDMDEAMPEFPDIEKVRLEGIYLNSHIGKGNQGI